MGFENFLYVGVSPIPRLIYTNLARNYPICLGPRLDSCLIQNYNFIQNLRKMRTAQNMVWHYLRKRDFDSKNSKWIFEMDFSREWDFDSKNSKWIFKGDLLRIVLCFKNKRNQLEKNKMYESKYQAKQKRTKSQSRIFDNRENWSGENGGQSSLFSDGLRRLNLIKSLSK